ncbi:MAG: serine/threonine-protein kinase [Acidobacteriota bacterium]
MSNASSMPFVVGQWVRGERFYGRAEQLDEILGGHRNCLWLLGTRRVGKTSLLKQLEHLTVTEPERGFFPVFWDFQGAEDPAELHLDFADALLDAEERLEEIGIELAQVEADDLFVSLGRLRRRLRALKLRLLLLCDEVEELIALNDKAPALLRKLRRAMQSREDIRSVLASSIRLWALAEQRGDTSPFLHGFTPPLYIQALSDDAARALIRQTQLATESRPSFDDTAVERIRRRCDNHPYLIQLVCKRCLELGSLDEAFEEVASDRMVSYFFSVDFEMLSDTEREIIRVVAAQTAATSRSIQRDLPIESGSLSGGLHRLEHLGFIRRDAERRFVLANHFFRRWLAELSGSQAPRPTAGGSAVDTTLVRSDAEATLTRDVQLGVLDGRYELQKELGAGATGVVFKAYDKVLGVQIAIKVLKGDLATHEEALERFRQEIVLSRDIGHPNILRVYHLGQSDGKAYLTMQLVEGPTLAQLIIDQAPFPEARVRALGSRLAEALAAAHARQVLHRDIKPQNILVGEGDTPFLTDFGLARVIGRPGITRGGLFLGTPYYTSPEQADLRPLDERSDIYALGLLLFEMAVGRRPFEADSTAEVLMMHRTATPPRPDALRPELAPDLTATILRCLEKEPAMRFASADALRLALGEPQ